VEISYDTEVIDLTLDDGRFTGVSVVRQGVRHEVRARAMVAAAGGFESNLAWLRDAWGPPADNFIVRGTPYNMGTVLKLLLAKGAKQVSDSTRARRATTAASSRAWTRSRSASW
jgi:tricarballylate dehydrogenase